MEATVAAVKRAKGYTEDVEFSAEDAHRDRPGLPVSGGGGRHHGGGDDHHIPGYGGVCLPWEFGRRIRDLMSRVPNIHRVVVAVIAITDLGWRWPTP